ncbi:MAG: tRNA (adenosine(37)-N6)-threonylcarbamoyltransferase complex ATPase subunit type 1 TsaE [Ascidiaceihabitans sp.]|jgi:tRNA threonylcarbamoyladenosine biosynthesis protein TsaE|nr:tRNA (adenosine(37)-N6)-threonylcarbamoyltransferase complex ATPase subunit type 1 TsaE [Ascidiaceihabitans sp.]
MANSNLKIHLADAEATANLASILAQNVQSGDTVLLLGEVGAGKTHFARSFIKSLLTVDEDVPSPTFTLVQTYDTVIGEVWHSDLYRLSAEQEIEELGLFDAMIEAVCLIEWPDRLGSYTPTDALHIELTPSSTLDSRVLIAQWDDPKWDAKTKGWRND